MIAAPPLSAGADHETSDWALARVPVAPVGAFGTVRGVTELEAALAPPTPMEFVAVAVNVYDCPLVSPVTMHWSGPPDHKHVWPPGEAVTR